MARFRCVTARCGTAPTGFEFEADRAQCPKCGTVNVIPLIDVHFLAPDPGGPIIGIHGRYKVACEPKRDGLALHVHDDYAATVEAPAVTCRSCRKTKGWRDMARMYKELRLDAALLEG